MFISFLVLIFLRPFIASLAFPYLNTAYSVILLELLLVKIFIDVKNKAFNSSALLSVRLPLLAWMLSLILSVIFAKNKLTSICHIYTYITSILLFITAITFTEKQKLLFIQTLILSGVFISALALYQYFFGFRHLLNYVTTNKINDPFIMDYIRHKRVFLPFVTPNSLAGYLIMLFPLILYFRFWKPPRFLRNGASLIKKITFLPRQRRGGNDLQKFSQWLGKCFYTFLYYEKEESGSNEISIANEELKQSILCVIKSEHLIKSCLFLLLTITLFLTKSIGAIICLFLISCFYIVLNKNQEKKLNLLLPIALLLITTLILFFRVYFKEPHISPIFSAVKRLDYWKSTLQVIKNSFFTGVGLGNFNMPQTRYSHNSYLQILAETGILGLLSFLWLIICAFRKAFKNIKSLSYKEKQFVLAVLLANLSFLFHNLIDFTFYLPEIAWIWWMILGLHFSLHTNTAS